MNPVVEETIARTITETTPFEKGVALLDEEMPGWADKIDLETFDIESSTRCVLGQLGGYTVMQSYLGIKAADFGFEAPENAARQYEELQKLWTNAIRERQSYD